jgi:hypothetical protein
LAKIYTSTIIRGTQTIAPLLKDAVAQNVTVPLNTFPQAQILLFFCKKQVGL